MKTIIASTTTVTETDRSRLAQLLKRAGPFVDVKPLGYWRTMSNGDRWLQIVKQVCVMGSARGMSDLIGDTKRMAIFTRATSLRSWKRHGFDKKYMASVLRGVTRFHRVAAQRLHSVIAAPGCVKGTRVTLFDGLPKGRNEMRSELMARCRIFQCKSASDFMIDTGLSHDVIALDTRVIGALKDHFDYRLFSAKRARGVKPATLSPDTIVQRLQSSKRLYFSVEDELRRVCQAADFSLAVLDQILFRFNGALEFLLKEIDSRPT